MKGNVFIELLAMTEARLGEASVDAMLDTLDLETGGAYTSVGNYSEAELSLLLDAITMRTGDPREETLNRLGARLVDTPATTFARLPAMGLEGPELIELAVRQAGVELSKLTNAGTQPRFSMAELSGGRLRMRYHGDPDLLPVWQGFFQELLDRSGGEAGLDIQPVADTPGTVAMFVVRSGLSAS